MEPAGYSKTPLLRKLGIKSGHRLLWIDPPEGFHSLLGPLPEDVELLPTDAPSADVVHVFIRQAEALKKALERLKEVIYPDGMLWVSWYKKSSGKQTDVNEDTVRELALPLGLVDVKVCAVDTEWSGLKLVWRKERRTR